MKAAGKSSIDIFCMFLAGDMIGIAIAAISGLVVKIWNWLKNTSVFKILFGTIKFILGMYEMIYIGLPKALLKSLWGAARAGVEAIFGMGGFGEIVDAFCRPWKEWWGGIKNLFATGIAAVTYGMSDRDYVDIDPTELNKEKSTRAKAAVRGLKMKGTPEDNLASLAVL